MVLENEKTGKWFQRVYCIEKTIRMEFPEASGEYAGFKPAEIGFTWSFGINSCE